MLNWQLVKMELPAVSVLICGNTSRTLFHPLTDIGLKLKSMPVMASSSLPKLKSPSKITPEPTSGNCHLKCFYLFSWFISSNSLTIILNESRPILNSSTACVNNLRIQPVPEMTGENKLATLKREAEISPVECDGFLFDFGLNTSVALLSGAPSYPWKVPDLMRLIFYRSCQITADGGGKKNKTVEAFGPSSSDASRCCIRVSLVVLSGAEPGLVPPDASHVAGEQRRRRGAERDEEPAGQTGVHHEAGVQPVGPADRAEGAGGSGSLRLRSRAPSLLGFRCRTRRMSHNSSLLASTSSIFLSSVLRLPFP